MTNISPFPRERRHTLYFLEEIRPFSPVFIDTEVDMTGVLAHRAAAGEAGRRYSVVSYVLHAAGRVLDRHPRANASIRGRVRPRIGEHQAVSGKVTFDRTLGGERVVLSTVLPSLQRATLDAIQDGIDQFRDTDAEQLPQLAALRALHRLPPPVARFLYHRATRRLASRPARLGTFSVTSLGHRAVDGFQSTGGTTLTFGVGRVIERPVVRGGELTAAPVLRLNLAFDHRVIDGAEAADVLTEVRDALEEYKAAALSSNGIHPVREAEPLGGES